LAVYYKRTTGVGYYCGSRWLHKSELSGKEKAAMLLIALGPERSAEIFKHLKEDEIEQLTLEIANIRTVSPEDKEEFWKNFIRYVLHRTTLPRVE